MTLNINNIDVQGIIRDEVEMVILEVFYFSINKIMKDTLLGTYFLSLLDDSKIYLIISLWQLSKGTKIYQNSFLPKKTKSLFLSFYTAMVVFAWYLSVIDKFLDICGEILFWEHGKILAYFRRITENYFPSQLKETIIHGLCYCKE